MTVIRAPSDDNEQDADEGKAVELTEAKSSVTKAVGRSIKYIRRVLGLKNKRKRRLRAPPGFKASRNPFFNFLRHLQVELQGMSASEVAREGGRRWRHMSDRDKLPYRQMAQRASRGRPSRRRTGDAADAMLPPRRSSRSRSRNRGSRKRARSRSSRSRGRKRTRGR